MKIAGKEEKLHAENEWMVIGSCVLDIRRCCNCSQIISLIYNGSQMSLVRGNDAMDGEKLYCPKCDSEIERGELE